MYAVNDIIARPEATCIGERGDNTLRANGRAAFVPLSDMRASLGESPAWSPFPQAIWWVDIDGRRLMRTGLGGATETWATPELPGFVQCLGEAVFLGMESGIFRFHFRTGRFERIVGLSTRGQRNGPDLTHG